MPNKMWHFCFEKNKHTRFLLQAHLDLGLGSFCFVGLGFLVTAKHTQQNVNHRFTKRKVH